MTDMDLTSLSLDDIIKKAKAGGARRAAGGRRGGAPAGAVRRRSSGATGTGSGILRRGGITKPQRNPKKWDNDKFFEVYGKGGRRNGGGSGPVGGGKAVCRLANIPYNVSQQELNDLFSTYKLARVSLHYDHRGKSLGTAELHGQRSELNRLVREYTKVEIDGRPLQVTIVEESSSKGSRSPPSRRPVVRRVGGGGGPRGGPGKRVGRGGAGGKKKFTAEELDKELDDYMHKKA